MDGKQLALLIPIIGIIGAFTMIVFLRRYENMEKMEMIKNGINPKDFKRNSRNFSDEPFHTLRTALLAIGVGLGVFLGNILGFSGIMTQKAGVVSMIFLCGGAGLAASYLIQMRQTQNKKSDNSNEAE